MLLKRSTNIAAYNDVNRAFSTHSVIFSTTDHITITVHTFFPTFSSINWMWMWMWMTMNMNMSTCYVFSVRKREKIKYQSMFERFKCIGTLSSHLIRSKRKTHTFTQAHTSCNVSKQRIERMCLIHVARRCMRAISIEYYYQLHVQLRASRIAASHCGFFRFLDTYYFTWNRRSVVTCAIAFSTH